MFKKSATLFLLSTLFLAGCGFGERDVQGSVFIVTKGGDNQKLGLVKILAIPESEIAAFIEAKKETIGTETAKLKSEIDAVKGKVQEAQTTWEELKTAYEALKAQKTQLETQRTTLNSQYDSYTVSRCEYGGYVTEEECDRQRNISRQIDALDRQISDVDPKMDKALTVWAAAEKILNAERAKMSGIVEKIAAYLTAQFLMDGLPEAKIKAVTDAEGKFSMVLPKGRYVFVATTQRRVGSTTEDYNWMVWVDTAAANPTQVTLSNQNVLGENTEDGVFKFKELIPSLDDPSSAPAPADVKV